MALPWIFGRFLRKSGGTMTGALTLSDGSTAEGVVSSSAWHIRYSSGIQICWGYVNCVNYAYSKMHYYFTFSVPFIDVNYQVGACPRTSAADVICALSDKATTQCSFGVRNLWQATDYWAVNVLAIAVGNWK